MPDAQALREVRENLNLGREDEKPDVAVTARWLGRRFTAAVNVAAGGEPVLSERMDLSRSDGRADLVGKIIEALPGVDAAQAEKELLRLVDERARRLDKSDQQEQAPHPTISEMLVNIASSGELTHDENRIGYARIEVDGHQETWPIKSPGFRQYLCRYLYKQCKKAAYSEAMKTALDLIEAKAVHEGPSVTVFVRVGEQGGAIYLDLCDDSWRVVQITPCGWKVLDRSPVLFRRSRGMLPLAAPVAGGSVNDLRTFLNVRDDGDFVLVVSWLLGVLSPQGPYPILNICGEQGSGKSFGQRVLRALVDPNLAPLRSEPREPRDLLISASNSWVLALDNLSRIPPWLSNACCRLSTGDGFATRQLYSDAEEIIFSVKRPLMFNGIGDLANRADLLDRCITIMLQAIPSATRRDERSLRSEFEEARPRVLGGLLDAVAAGLAHREKVRINPEQQPRMLDFALWAMACERGLPWKAGAFINTYEANRQDANSIAIEASVVGQTVMKFMQDRNRWTGTCKDLLKALESIVDEKALKRKDWPSNERKLRADLDRVAPNLRGEGIDTQRLPRKGQSRPILLQRIGSGSATVAEGRQDSRPPLRSEEHVGTGEQVSSAENR